MSADIQGLISYIAKSVVNQPDAVSVEEIETRRAIIYKLVVASEDMGRVIGKNGQMANAVRDLLRVAAIKSGQRITLEICE